MVLRDFPRQEHVESGVSKVVQQFGLENIVVNAKSHDIEYNNLVSPLSLKWTIKGSEWYEVEGTELSIDEDHLMVLNDQQTYSTYIRSESEVESFCLFFRNDLFSEVLTSMASSTEALLDNPDIVKRDTLEFIERRYRMDHRLRAQLTRLKVDLDTQSVEQSGLEQHYYDIMESLLRLNLETDQIVRSLPFARKSTQKELYKRVYRAKDYMDSFLTETFDLDDVAEVACLSKYHFIRSFKKVIGVAPHQYLTKQRLELAKTMLLDDTPVQEVCWALGFSNQYSFSRLFKKHFGMAPTHFRQRAN